MNRALATIGIVVKSGIILAFALLLSLPGRAQNVIAWGSNTYGQLNVPANATNVIAVAAGWYHSVALKDDGTVVAWGDNTKGQITPPTFPTQVNAIAAGVAHNLVLLADGTVMGWGDNTSGQSLIPGSALGVVAIAAGYNHNLALRSDGTVVAWGRNVYGQCNVPNGLSNVVAIAAGAEHSLALKDDGSVTIWGGSSNAPMMGAKSGPPKYLKDIHALAGGTSFNLTIDSKGQLHKTGYFKYSAPAAATNLVSINAATNCNLVLRGDGRVFGWGSGAGTNIPTSATNIISIAAGLAHGLAVQGDGRPYITGSVAYRKQCSAANPLPLSVRAVGQTALNYQWFSNSLPIVGMINAIPLIPAGRGWEFHRGTRTARRACADRPRPG